MNIVRGIGLLSILFLIAMGPSGGRRDSISYPDADKVAGSKAHDFTLNNINGKSVSLSSFRGRVVLLNFWATWCPPCRAEMPSMNKLYNELHLKGFDVLAVSLDNSEAPVKEFILKNRFGFQVLLDEGKAVSKLYRVFSMPTTFLINKNGLIVEKFYGEYDWSSPEIRKQIEKLL